MLKEKVKRLNKRIENLQEELQTYQLSNSRLRNKNDRLKVELEGQNEHLQKAKQYLFEMWKEIDLVVKE